MGEIKINAASEKDGARPETSLDIGESHSSLGREKLKKIPNINAAEIVVFALLAAMFIMGWVSLNSCSITRMIPIYLIVAGATGILIKVFLETTNPYLFNLVVSSIGFYIAWFGVGTYYVFREYQPNYDPTEGPYCNRIAYLLAFWVLILQYTLLGLFLFISTCKYIMNKDFKS